VIGLSVDSAAKGYWIQLYVESQLSVGGVVETMASRRWKGPAKPKQDGVYPTLYRLLLTERTAQTTYGTTPAHLCVKPRKVGKHLLLTPYAAQAGITYDATKREDLLEKDHEASP
jgi:hypothetical protein